MHYWNLVKNIYCLSLMSVDSKKVVFFINLVGHVKLPTSHTHTHTHNTHLHHINTSITWRHSYVSKPTMYESSWDKHLYLLCSTKSKLTLSKITEYVTLEPCISKNLPEQFLRVYSRFVLPLVCEAVWASWASHTTHLIWCCTIRVILLAFRFIGENL